MIKFQPKLFPKHIINKININLFGEDLSSIYIQENLAEDEFIKQIDKIYKETMLYDMSKSQKIK